MLRFFVLFDLYLLTLFTVFALGDQMSLRELGGQSIWYVAKVFRLTLSEI